MKLRNLSIILLLLFSFMACKTTKEANVKTDNKEMTYQKLAKEKFGDTAQLDFLMNKSKTFVVCTSSKGSYTQEPYNNLKFFIYDIKGEGIIFEDKFIGGETKWISDSQIKANWVPSMPQAGDKTTASHYIYDVKKKVKIGGKTSLK